MHAERAGVAVAVAVPVLVTVLPLTARAGQVIYVLFDGEDDATGDYVLNVTRR